MLGRGADADAVTPWLRGFMDDIMASMMPSWSSQQPIMRKKIFHDGPGPCSVFGIRKAIIVASAVMSWGAPWKKKKNRRIRNRMGF